MEIDLRHEWKLLNAVKKRKKFLVRKEPKFNDKK